MLLSSCFVANVLNAAVCCKAWVKSGGVADVAHEINVIYVMYCKYAGSVLLGISFSWCEIVEHITDKLRSEDV